jgi:hypothetical protein
MEIATPRRSKSSTAPSNARQFSQDVLKIEISGAKRTHFSIVDVPGLFHSPTKEQTIEDRELVEQTVAHYMAQPQSVLV